MAKDVNPPLLSTLLHDIHDTYLMLSHARAVDMNRFSHLLTATLTATPEASPPGGMMLRQVHHFFVRHGP